jgi:hypothetical protein
LFSPAGSYSLRASGSCFGPSDGHLVITARLQVRSIANALFPLGAAMAEIYRQDIDASCDAEERTGRFDFTDRSRTVSSPVRMVVRSGEMLLLTAQYTVRMFTFGPADVLVNLSSPGFGLNVPVVLAQLES